MLVNKNRRRTEIKRMLKAILIVDFKGNYYDFTSLYYNYIFSLIAEEKCELQLQTGTIQFAKP